MKRIIAIILAMVMVLTFISCGKKDEVSDTTTDDVVNNETTDDAGEATDDTTSDDTATDGAATGDTLGTTLLADFKAKVEANPAMTAEEIANEIIANPAILFAPAVMPVEPGFLSGFTTEIHDFEEAAMFAPMIGSIAFVGYIFKLADGADVNAFISNLEANCDLRWNICVSAEETVTGNVGNTVFFVMCPTSLEG